MRIQKSLTRLAAVQLLYKINIFYGSDMNELELNINGFADEIIDMFENYEIFSQEQLSSNGLKELIPTKSLLLEFLEKIIENHEFIDDKITKFLAEGWNIKKLDLIIISVLRMSVCELCYYETPTKVILDEYTSLSSDFYDKKRVGFVNGILDKISKDVR